jgi:recombination protein RecT
MSEIAKQNRQLSAKDYFNQPGVQNKFKEILGNQAPAFITSVMQAVSANPLLAKADPASLYNSAAVAAILGLPINQSIGQAYIVPYRVKQKDGSYKDQAQFQLGYKGLIQLAMRSGKFVRLNSTDVREGEVKSRNRMTGAIEFDWIQDDRDREKKKIIGYLSYFKLTNGFESEFYMSIEEVEAHAKKYSQSYKSGFGQWKDNFDKMALKTVTKLHLNSGEAPLSVQMEKAIQADQAVLKDDSGEVEYVDHEEVKTDEELRRIREWIQNAESIDHLEMIKDSYGADIPAELMDLYTKKEEHLKTVEKK